jgi:hypothetical protein
MIPVSRQIVQYPTPPLLANTMHRSGVHVWTV